MGGKLGKMQLTSMVLLESSSIVSTKFQLDRERRYLQGFCVEKLVLLSFRGYLGEIESEKKETSNCSYTLFVNGQCCVRVSASYFEVLRPVTMEGQKLEIAEDASQNLPERSPMDPIWYNIFLKRSRIPAKNDLSRRPWPTSA